MGYSARMTTDASGRHSISYRWIRGRLEETTAAASGIAASSGIAPSSGMAPSSEAEDPEALDRLDVADSFLVVDSTALAVDRHYRRFSRSALERGFRDEDELAAFWSAAIAAVPSQGAWFPRLELSLVSGDWILSLRLRAAPERHRTIRLATFTDRDPRTAPTIKGPDLANLPELRRKARNAGADEYVFLDRGAIADGASSTVLWWRGDTLCQPADGLRRVDGTTSGLIAELAEKNGSIVVGERSAPSEVAGCQIWAVNALHGIRLVTEWAGLDVDASDDAKRRALHWQGELDACYVLLRL
jgi:branched-subunit amino acid aminotransferase/4-amino-4-deoxychorismate lyase